MRKSFCSLKNALEFGQKAAGYMKVKMHISYGKDRLFTAAGMTRKLKIHSIGI
jgi:hypothetical protein